MGSPPSPPLGPVKVTNITSKGCTVSWKPPQDDGGSTITEYLVESMDPKSGKVEKQLETDQLQCEVKNVKKGLVHFCVTAKNAQGMSDKLVGPKDPVWIKDPFEVPGPPLGLKVVEADDKSVVLSWNPPAKDGGSPVTDYSIEQCPDSGKWSTVGMCKPDETLNFTVKGLAAGSKYQFSLDPWIFYKA